MALGGLCIGDYTVIRTLGAGATGKVKLARHSETGQLVALKIIRKDLLTRKRNLSQKVHREIAVMKLLSGNCIAAENRSAALAATFPEPPPKTYIGVMKLLDVYDTENSFVLVLEYCEGGELFDVLVRWGRLPEEQVLDVFQQLVYALAFCHRRGICHRDLKLENVLLTSDGRVKLADFGMASLQRPGSLLDTSCGSPQYCAPEVILGEQYTGCAADVWSLGVVLYAITTGGLPFDDDNLHRLVTKINSGAFYMPEEVPQRLAEVIQSMLTVDLSKRATLEDVMGTDWFKSRPPRADIHIENATDILAAVPAVGDEPVCNPDPEILRYLIDLGLGNDEEIRRRLQSGVRCAELDFYYQLVQLCGDSLSFRPLDSVPVSPRRPEGDEAARLARRSIQQLDTLQSLVKEEAPESPADNTQLSWLQSLSASIAAEEKAHISPHSQSQAHLVIVETVVPAVAALRSVTSV